MIVNIIFTIVMLVLAIIDIKTTKSSNHKDFKSIILTIGVLGTFVGVFIGLLDFDINNIESSIPFLLNGLKVAFYTSIVGMSISVTISIYQRFVGFKIESKDNLDFITLQTKKLDDLQNILQSNNEIKNAILSIPSSNEKLLETNLELLNKITNSNNSLIEQIVEFNTSFSKNIINSIKDIESTLNTHNKNLAVKLNSLQNDMNSKMDSVILNISSLDKNINSNLLILKELLSNALIKQIQEINFNISKEIEKLSNNFSSDVICGVNNLSETFSDTINTHFSENFKRFNKAVDNLLSWQIEYKKSVLDSNEILSQSSINIENISKITDNILNRDEKTISLYKEVVSIMKDYKAQNIALDKKLNAIRDLGNGALEALKFMNTFFNDLNAHLTSTNENIILSLKNSNENLISTTQKSIKEVFFNAIKEFESSNKKIINELNARDNSIYNQIVSSTKGIEELSNIIINNNKLISQSYQKLNKDVEINTKAISKNTSEMISEINKDGIKHLKNTTKLYFDDISNTQYKILNNMSNQISKNQEMLDSTLITMATKYLESLEQISISSIEASKELNLINIESIRNLNDEIANYVKENSNLLNSSNLELLNILEILQKQVEIAMDNTNNMQNSAKSSIKEIEEALVKSSDSFKGDYEWFLRRVRELIGQRLG
ncbi:hypothetical protein [Helicobacter sp. MIT 14-3879]|uniref:hypothetical protein n=1 Tax=Helicobacter sp. MIT 14-3879 TaxID=2040649 RepID=UPI000E1F7F46|nr:hypothetical protein [Helicobacter sp. MIT 14-3879]RDU64824.1 hypothetical protein CQA44_03695 [Helicobacter sp. MIT 14-3879]